MNTLLAFFVKRILRLAVTGLLAVLFAVPMLAQGPPPAIVSSVGYINGTSLTAHTANPFNSSGASTLVAFVSTNSPWDGLAVGINSVKDNLGNSWTLLQGPTLFSGSSHPLLSAIYYVNNPATSSNQTITVQLSNPAPLVFHVFAISGSDVTAPPITSPIGDPGAGATSATVTSAPISVPNNSLLLGWAKNETGANATALNGFSLDGQSTSFLWAESQTVISAGSYSASFQYDSAIGWQTAIVGLKPSTAPVASNQSVLVEQDTPESITLNATSPLGFPLTYSVVTQPAQGTLSGSAPNLTYTPNLGYTGPDSFTFQANDGTNNSNVATVSITVHGLSPVINGTVGYINGTPLMAHTSTAFNSLGASSLVAFVSSHPSWDGLPVSLNGLTDNVGNTWTLLTGPTQFPGNSFTLMSAIYYVNSPITSATHTVTALLTNPAPLVLHVFAVSQSDVTGPPITSAITDPGAGAVSATVTTSPITVPVNSLLLSWAKNETGATATAVNGYSLDPQSTSFLWAESQAPLSAGSFTGNFQYDSAIGWQTAIVALRPKTSGPPAPAISSAPANPTSQTGASFSFSDTQAGVVFLCQLDGVGFTVCSSPVAYSGLSEGSHTFSVKAEDTNNHTSGATNFTWTVDTTPPPVPTISSTPTNPTNQTSASFSFSDTEAGVSFLCSLDNSVFTACSSPQAYTALSPGGHTFSVMAQDGAGNPSTAATFTWTITTAAPPVPTISSAPANPSNQTSASFGFTDTQAGVTFLCSLDNSVFTACSSPKAYSNLSQAIHTFSVKAQDAALNQSNAASYTWRVDTTPPPTPAITSKPPNPTNQTSASFSFTDTQAGVTFLCSLDGSAFGTCSSPKAYSNLSQATHTFSVKARDAALNPSPAASYAWTVDTTPPPTPTITSTPASLTNQASASFSFTDTQAGVTFLCSRDGGAFGTCSSPKTYNNLSQATHTFSVKARDAAGNQSPAATFTWIIDRTAPPKPVITSAPRSSTTQTTATFAFLDTQPGVTFRCQLDNSGYASCTSPVFYSGLSRGSHSFSVRAGDAAGNLSGPTTYKWSIF